eukprot:2700767-Amphidinium_carterae.1
MKIGSTALQFEGIDVFAAGMHADGLADSGVAGCNLPLRGQTAKGHVGRSAPYCNARRIKP